MAKKSNDLYGPETFQLQLLTVGRSSNKLVLNEVIFSHTTAGHNTPVFNNKDQEIKITLKICEGSDQCGEHQSKGTGLMIKKHSLYLL